MHSDNIILLGLAIVVTILFGHVISLRKRLNKLKFEAARPVQFASKAEEEEDSSDDWRKDMSELVGLYLSLGYFVELTNTTLVISDCENNGFIFKAETEQFDPGALADFIRGNIPKAPPIYTQEEPIEPPSEQSKEEPVTPQPAQET